MQGKVNYTPDGYHTVTPYLSVQGGAAALEFYKTALGATEIMRMSGPDDKIGHAEIQLGNSRIMLADEFPEMNFRSPKTLGGSPVGLMIYVENADATVERAVAAGAKLIHPIKNQFYGDRSGTIEDPFGHTWTIATHIEDLTPEEMERRAKQEHH